MLVKKNQYMIFVDLYKTESPVFYVLSNQQWQVVLETIKPSRNGAEIKDGALEWNWIEDGEHKKRRGSQLHADEILEYMNNWSVLPGVKSA